jgi:hypothetical protein
MKLINIIFSIYIIALSCMPCADAAINIGNNPVSYHTDTNSSSDNHHEDACSPFCICNCCNCAGFYKSNDYTKTNAFVNTSIEKQTTEYTSTLFSNFQNSIWQPPQIS